MQKILVHLRRSMCDPPHPSAVRSACADEESTKMNKLSFGQYILGSEALAQWIRLATICVPAAFDSMLVARSRISNARRLPSLWRALFKIGAIASG